MDVCGTVHMSKNSDSFTANVCASISIIICVAYVHPAHTKASVSFVQIPRPCVTDVMFKLYTVLLKNLHLSYTALTS